MFVTNLPGNQQVTVTNFPELRTQSILIVNGTNVCHTSFSSYNVDGWNTVTVNWRTSPTYIRTTPQVNVGFSTLGVGGVVSGGGPNGLVTAQVQGEEFFFFIFGDPNDCFELWVSLYLRS